jgi:hypothetical protein
MNSSLTKILSRNQEIKSLQLAPCLKQTGIKIKICIFPFSCSHGAHTVQVLALGERLRCAC